MILPTMGSPQHTGARYRSRRAAQLCDADADHWRVMAHAAAHSRDTADDQNEAKRAHEHAAAMAAHSRFRAQAIRALKASVTPQTETEP